MQITSANAAIMAKTLRVSPPRTITESLIVSHTLPL